MRLWHQTLIPYLPRAQLLGQHRECCALRGRSWGRKHSTVDYVFKYNPYRLYCYHVLVTDEMKKRGYKVDERWYDPQYRGRNCLPNKDINTEICIKNTPIFPEHDLRYLKECIENLYKKGAIFFVFSKSNKIP